MGATRGEVVGQGYHHCQGSSVTTVLSQPFSPCSSRTLRLGNRFSPVQASPADIAGYLTDGSTVSQDPRLHILGFIHTVYVHLVGNSSSRRCPPLWKEHGPRPLRALLPCCHPRGILAIYRNPSSIDHTRGRCIRAASWVRISSCIRRAHPHHHIPYPDAGGRRGAFLHILLIWFASGHKRIPGHAQRPSGSLVFPHRRISRAWRQVYTGLSWS